MWKPNSQRHFEASAYAKSLLLQMRKNDAEGTRIASPLFTKWMEGIQPTLRTRTNAMLRDDDVKLHSHIHARNSSMAFAFNLFTPFRVGDPQPLAALLHRVRRDIRI